MCCRDLVENWMQVSFDEGFVRDFVGGFLRGFVESF